MISFYIDGKLPALNDYIRVTRSNRYASSKLKKETEDMILWQIKLAKKGIAEPPYIIKFIWYEKTKRRDKDNVCFAKKFILDALQKSKTIEDDGNRYIKGFKDLFIYGKKQGVEVYILGADEYDTMRTCT